MRPCPWVGCKHHLLFHVSPSGSIRFNRDRKTGRNAAITTKSPRVGRRGEALLNDAVERLFELDQSCALDVAEWGGIGDSEVGVILGITYERSRQIAASALAKVKKAIKARESDA